MGNGNDMNIIKFIESFPDENSCMQHFRQVHEKEGIVCKKCGRNRYYWLQAKWQRQCSECHLQLYLDEFCYKLNRRYFGDRLFDRLTVAVATNYWHYNGKANISLTVSYSSNISFNFYIAFVIKNLFPD
jgi:hypothetical protein